jgi:hypothetical protein
MTPDLQGYEGQCMPGSLALRLLGQCSLDSPAVLPLTPQHDPISARPSLQSLPLSSILICHVAHSPSLPVLIELGVFDWWLSPQSSAHAGSSLVDFSTLMMETIRSSETSVHTRSTRCHNPEYGILNIIHWSQCNGTNPKMYMYQYYSNALLFKRLHYLNQKVIYFSTYLNNNLTNNFFRINKNMCELRIEIYTYMKCACIPILTATVTFNFVCVCVCVCVYTDYKS